MARVAADAPRARGGGSAVSNRRAKSIMKRFDMAHHRRFDMTHYKTPARRQAAGHNLRKRKTVGQNRRRAGACPHDGPMRLTMKSRLRADARISPAMRVR